MKKILVVFGTRPEAVKMCPVVNALKSHSEIQTVTCVTGQHSEMLYPILKLFQVEPEYDLDIMKNNQNPSYITARILKELDTVLAKEKPDMIMVHGDTTTSLAAALSGFYKKTDIVHVEAGLRTYDMNAPFPEEFNRQVIDLITSIYFAPTRMAKDLLIREGKPEKNVYVTGNTVIDALSTTISDDYCNDLLEWVGGDRLILLTAHRRENHGDIMRQMFYAIREVINEMNDVKVIYPVHPNPNVKNIAEEVFNACDKVRLVEPMDLIDFHNIMSRSYLILTDSGGIQEEAPSLGIPVLVMRNKTERPEGISAGTARLIGTQEKIIKKNLRNLLIDSHEYMRMAKAVNPYGDGQASKRIAEILIGRLNGVEVYRGIGEWEN